MIQTEKRKGKANINYIKVVASRYFYGEKLKDICDDLGINLRTANSWKDNEAWTSEIQKLEKAKNEFEYSLIQKEQQNYIDNLTNYQTTSESLQKSFAQISLILNREVLSAITQLKVDCGNDSVEFVKRFEKTGIEKVLRTCVLSSAESRALLESVHSISTIASYVSKNAELN